MKGTGAEILVRYLEQEGVRYVFGVPGGHLLAFYDALRGSSIVPVLAKHEGGAAYMATGYAHVSGELGVCCGTVGPGATNLVSGVAAAYMDSQPVLAITAQVGTISIGKGALQEAAGEGRTFSQVQLFGSLTKYSTMVTRPDKLAETIQRALRIAFSGRPGPVHLDLPADVLRGQVEEEIISVEDYRPQLSTAPAAEDIDKAASQLISAQRPAILVGRGGLQGEAPRHILHLAESLACPVATTMPGKGAIPEDHPLSLGCVGLYGTHAANNYMRSGLDVLLVIGSSMHEFTTHVWDPVLQPTTALIQVDVDPLEIGKNYPVDLGILGDASTVTRLLAEQVAAIGTTPSRSLDHLAELKRSTDYFCEAKMRSDSIPIKPQRAMAELRAALPDDAIVFTDIGNNVTWVERNFVARRPDTTVSICGLAGMGSGVAAVIGGKLAAQERPVVVVCGDGDFQMHGMEVMTAVNHRIPVIWIILSNGNLAMIRDIQKMTYQGRVVASEFVNPDFVKLADAFGADGYHVEKPDEIGPAVHAALQEQRPAIISIVVDPDEAPPSKPRMLAMERSLGLPPMRERVGIGAIKALLGMLKER
jgi:acetolactate synthase-1/2/3 large subunit